MNLKEALPKPGQVPLGGIDPGDSEVLIKGYGRVKYSQLSKMTSQVLDSLKKEIDTQTNDTSLSNKYHGKRQNVVQLQTSLEELNSLLLALIEHLHSQNKSVPESEDLGPKKAKTILRHGEVGGQKLSDKQRRFMGAMASGEKPR